MSHLLKNLLIAIGITAFIAVVYITLFQDTETEETSTVFEEKDAVVLQTEKILADIQEVDAYEINDSLFKNTAFLSLKDFRVDIQDVQTGRDNPFTEVR